MENINLSDVASIIKSGKFVSVDFIKKDGTMRTLTGRAHVHNHVKGGTLAFNPSERGMVVMWESDTRNRKNENDSGYRMITLSRVLRIRANKKEYKVI